MCTCRPVDRGRLEESKDKHKYFVRVCAAGHGASGHWQTPLRSSPPAPVCTLAHPAQHGQLFAPQFALRACSFFPPFCPSTIFPCFAWRRATTPLHMYHSVGKRITQSVLRCTCYYDPHPRYPSLSESMRRYPAPGCASASAPAPAGSRGYPGPGRYTPVSTLPQAWRGSLARGSRREQQRPGALSKASGQKGIAGKDGPAASGMVGREPGKALPPTRTHFSEDSSFPALFITLLKSRQPVRGSGALASNFDSPAASLFSSPSFCLA